MGELGEKENEDENFSQSKEVKANIPSEWWH